MSPTAHTIASGVVSITFAYFTRSLGGTLLCFFSGILIDLDHVLDYWIAKKKLPLRYKDLFSFCAYEKMGKVYLVLHSYELHVIFWLAIFYWKLNVLWMGLAVGMTTHLVFDQIVNRCLQPLGYFAWNRFKHGFSKKYTFREEHYKKLT